MLWASRGPDAKFIKKHCALEMHLSISSTNCMCTVNGIECFVALDVVYFEALHYIIWDESIDKCA